MVNKLIVPKKLEVDFKNLLSIGLAQIEDGPFIDDLKLTNNEKRIIKIVKRYVNGK